MAGPVQGPGVPPVSQPQPLHRVVIGAAGEAARHRAALVILGVDHATTENTLTHSALSSLVTVLCLLLSSYCTYKDDNEQRWPGALFIT